ncbi:MAG: sugar porter family MFS transporter [Planctomycetes bacterium]|nr:sugar porter family MFS transporter [Planctomycetota bacterium]
MNTLASAASAPLSGPSRFRVLGAAGVAALGGFLFGFDTAVISGTTGALKTLYGLTGNELGFTVASGLIGTILGSLLASAPSERFGRRPVLRAVALLFLVASLGCGLALGWPMLVAARFLGGIAVGAASVVSPMYIAEISPAPWRGRLVAVAQLNVVLGILVAYLSNWGIAQLALPGELSWRWMLGIQALPSALFFVLLYTIPESPRWLAKQGLVDAAGRVLARLGHADPTAELAEIRASLAGESAAHRAPLFRRALALPVTATILVATFNQISGINALIYYAADIFAMAGSSRDSALLQSVAIGGANLLGCLLAMTIIDRVGRRPLLIIGGIACALCLGGTAWAFHQPVADGRLLLSCLIGFIFFFSFSQGAVIWVFISEIFPNTVRAKGQALGSFTHWFWAAVVSWSFPIIAEHARVEVFVFSAAMMALQAVLAWRLMPETKGQSLEQLGQRIAGH